MHCTCCGAPVEAEDIFCPGCGARLDGSSAGEPVPAPVEEPVEEPVAQPVPAPEEAGARPSRKKPHIALRILMQLISLVLCFVLLGTAIGAVMLLDLRMLTSAGGIEKVISSIFTVSPAPARSAAVHAPVRIDLCAARPSDELQLQLLSSRTATDPAQDSVEIIYGRSQLECIASDPELVTVYPQADGSYYIAIQDGPEFILQPQYDGSCMVATADGLPYYVQPDGLVLDHLGEPAEWPFGENVRLTYDPSLDSASGQPDDTGSSDDVSGTLSEYIFRYYDQIQAQYGDDLPVTRQQLQSILNQPSVQEFLSEKASEYVQDILTGSESASISTDELMALLEENRELLEREFDITITPEIEQQLRSGLTTVLEEQDLSGQIRETINRQLDSVLSGGSSWSDGTAQGSTLRTIQSVLFNLLSTRMLVGIAVVCLVLLALLCLANWYNIPAGLTWASVPCIFGGLIVTVPLLILRSQPRILLSMMGANARALMNLLLSFTDVMLPVHCGLLIFGLLLLIASIVWRIVRSNRRKAAQTGT